MRRFIGLMSGTSLDAVDAVLLECDSPRDRERGAATAASGSAGAGAGAGAAGRQRAGLRTAGFVTVPIVDALRAQLAALLTPAHDELARAARAAQALADQYADAIATLLAQCGLPADAITAIGAHGQTVRHCPEAGYTLQLLDAARLAERCRIPVVHDLRGADVAAGGAGAPLVPAFHEQVFRDARERRAVVNLGGIANISVLPAAGETPEAAPGTAPGARLAARTAAERPAGTNRERERARRSPAEPVTGFDTGPANTLLDTWCREHTGRAFDVDGRWARGGTVHEGLLRRLLADPYFTLPAPKSTGREYFHPGWLKQAMADGAPDDDGTRAFAVSGGPAAAAGEPESSGRRAGAGSVGEIPAGNVAPADVQATLVELTVRTIARACRDAGAQAVYACGGGTRNLFLMERLRSLLAPIPLKTTDRLGIDPEAVEAAAFAWLAMRRIDGLPGNLPAVTGARGPRVLGTVASPFVARLRSG